MEIRDSGKTGVADLDEASLGALFEQQPVTRLPPMSVALTGFGPDQRGGACWRRMVRADPLPVLRRAYAVVRD